MCLCASASQLVQVSVCVWSHSGGAAARGGRGAMSEEASWRTITRRVNICFPSFLSGS